MFFAHILILDEEKKCTFFFDNNLGVEGVISYFYSRSK